MTKNGTKTSGVRSVKAAHIAIDHLVEFFGNRNIQKIQFDDLEKYKKHRLSQKKKNGKPIKLATAHRELSKARRMFNVAISKKWLYVNRSRTRAMRSCSKLPLKDQRRMCCRMRKKRDS